MGVKLTLRTKPVVEPGIGAISKAKPDGYTVGFVSTSPITIRPHMMKAPYYPLNDLTHKSIRRQ